MKEKNILVHGYNKSSKDMKVLKNYLNELGYENILVDLPLTFREFQYSTFILEGILHEVIKNLEEGEKINFIGHSTGGLVIRNLLSTTPYANNINKCILIATPNNGNELADIAGKVSKTFINIFKTLGSIQSKEVQSLKLKNIPSEIEIGAIAGNKNNLLLGKLLKDKNDGRVTVKSVQYNGLQDFITLPYGHKEIHYQQTTASLVDTFIKTGKFFEDI